MRRYLKEWIRSTFAKRNILVRGHAPDAVSGIDFERDIRILLPHPTPLCMDVGANRGQTIERLQRLFPAPQIYAFEPSGASFAYLQAKQYGERVRLFNVALGEEEGEREFINYQSSDLSSFLPLTQHSENRFREIAVKDTERVILQTLDRFLAAHAIGQIDLLKIDTQGYDYNVLRGASESLKRGIIRTIFIELNFVRMYEGQSSAAQIIEFLGAHNFYLVDLYEKIRQEPTHTIAWCTALFAKR